VLEAKIECLVRKYEIEDLGLSLQKGDVEYVEEHRARNSIELRLAHTINAVKVHYVKRFRSQRPAPPRSVPNKVVTARIPAKMVRPVKPTNSPQVNLEEKLHNFESTLLSKITRANPKIASYPFTTLEPNLGIMSLFGEGRGNKSGKKEIVVADIPGLIEGASEGRGLGLDFLRHVENCSVLMFVLYLDESVVFDESISNNEKAQRVLKQYQDLQTELTNYHPDLPKKPYILTLNKIDIYSPELIDAIRSLFKQQNMVLMPFSGVSGEGLGGVAEYLSTWVPE